MNLNAQQQNGVYLLSVESLRHNGYVVKSASDNIIVDSVQINGNYVGTSDYFETECDAYTFPEQGVMNLIYNQTEAADD